MNEKSLIGVVTVTFNSAAVLHDFMESALKQTHEKFVLYAVDNASSDDTLDLLAQYADPRIRIIRNQENVGVAEGNNIGIRAALQNGCEAVLLINNDAAFDADLFSKLRDGLNEYHCDMTVPKILFYDDPRKIWCAGGYFSAWRGSARHFGFEKLDDGSFDQARRVDYAPTCCMLIRKQVFEKVGLMDPNYFVYFDDTDFCWRARKVAIQLIYTPEARLFHKVASLSGGIESELVIRYGARNRIYYLLKTQSLVQNVLRTPVYMVHLFWKYLVLRRSSRNFRIAQRGFLEGVALYLRNFGIGNLFCKQSLEGSAISGRAARRA